MTTEYEKLKLSLRYFLLGRRYYMAVDALEFGAEHHVGLRKDGVTPEYQHQIEIANYIRTLEPSLMYPEETIAAVFLHDVTEDYGVPHSVISNRFGALTGNAVYLMDKNGKTPEAFYAGIAGCPIASIDKGGDRNHNLGSMSGVFTPEKQRQYIAEAETRFLPMLKISKRSFPKQEAAYENIKFVMKTHIDLIRLTLPEAV